MDFGGIEPIKGPDNEAVANCEAVEGEGNPGEDVSGDLNTRIAANDDTVVSNIDGMTNAAYKNI